MTGRTTRLIERDARIEALAHEGKTAKEIASIEKIAVGAVYAWARAAGFKLERLDIARKDRDAKLMILGEAGKTPDEIAIELGMKPSAVRFAARVIGVKLKRGYRSPLTEGRQARIGKMVSMYRQGVTLQKIGDQFGITRERVRQLIGKRGVKSIDGGKSVVAAAQALAREQDKEARSIAKYGLPRAVVEQLRKDGVTYAFQQQRNHARIRGIDWKLSFGQWFAIWQASGKLHLRGRGKGKYVMSRVSDTGCYEMGNVHIQLATENSKEAVKQWKGKVKANRGVYCLYPGREMAWLAKVGQTRLGFFKSEAEAVAARTAYLEANPQKHELLRGRGYAHIKGKDGRADRYQVMVGSKYVGSYLTPDAALAARANYIAAQAKPTPAAEAREVA
jgi:DNA-binding CsgD family transcriptional regulator